MIIKKVCAATNFLTINYKCWMANLVQREANKEDERREIFRDFQKVVRVFYKKKLFSLVKQLL